jgi:hypothetical protein
VTLHATDSLSLMSANARVFSDAVNIEADEKVLLSSNAAEFIVSTDAELFTSGALHAVVESVDVEVTGNITLNTLGQLDLSAELAEIFSENNLTLNSGGDIGLNTETLTASAGESVSLAGEAINMGLAGSLSAFVDEAVELFATKVDIDGGAELEVDSSMAGAQVSKAHLSAGANIEVNARTTNLRATGIRGGRGGIKLSSAPQRRRITIDTEGTGESFQSQQFVSELSQMLGVDARRLRVVEVEDEDARAPGVVAVP